MTLNLSIKTNQIGQYFLIKQRKRVTKLGKEYPISDKVTRYENRYEVARAFSRELFKLDKENKKLYEIRILSKYNFNQCVASLDWVAMKLIEKDYKLSRFLLKWKVILIKIYEADHNR